jgi:hypothetical protein
MDNIEEPFHEIDTDTTIRTGTAGECSTCRTQTRRDDRLWYGLSSMRPRRERGTKGSERR